MTKYYSAHWFRGEWTGEHEKSVNLAFSRAAKIEGILFGPIRRDVEAEAEMALREDGSNLRVYSAEPMLKADGDLNLRNLCNSW